MSSTNSRVVRCHGTERLPNASPTTRSAESSGRLRMPMRASPMRTRSAFEVWSPRRSRPMFSTVGSISSTVLWVPGILGGEVPRQREAATADVQRVERLVFGPRHRDRVAERLHVVELEVRRVVEVDVAVHEVVEPEDAPARLCEVVLDRMQ